LTLITEFLLQLEPQRTLAAAATANEFIIMPGFYVYLLLMSFSAEISSIRAAFVHSIGWIQVPLSMWNIILRQ